MLVLLGVACIGGFIWLMFQGEVIRAALFAVIIVFLGVITLMPILLTQNRIGWMYPSFPTFSDSIQPLIGWPQPLFH